MVRRFGKGTLLVEQRGHVLLVALSRQEVKNAFSDNTYRDLIQMLDEARTNESIAAVILTGHGPYFSSGADLKEVAEKFGEEELNEKSRQTLQLPVGQFMMTMLDFPKVLVAAVNGPCVGIGVTLLFHCDLCFCSPSATFWAPFSRLALVPEFCSSVAFQETMGLAKANELLLLGRKIDAATAVKWNICSRILPEDEQRGTHKAAPSPFADGTISSQVCNILEKELLALPRAISTATTFVELIRGQKREHLKNVCQSELQRLDERFNSGEVVEAALQLSFGKKSKL